MKTLVACLSTGKGTWGHVSRLIQDGDFEKIFLFTNAFGEEKFAKDEKTELIVLEGRQPLIDTCAQMQKAIEEKITEQEVYLNLVSGDGKEHMALLSAIMKAGKSFRLVALTTEGIKEL